MKNNYQLKILPQYFEEVINGNKKSELRFNDRDFKVGDIYDLREYNPTRKRYTGRAITIKITYVLKGFDALKEGWCMFSFERKEDCMPNLVAPNYEAEYHRCVGTMARIHNEREENKSAILALTKLLAEQSQKIANLEQEKEDEYWRRRDNK